MDRDMVLVMVVAPATAVAPATVVAQATAVILATVVAQATAVVLDTVVAQAMAVVLDTVVVAQATTLRAMDQATRPDMAVVLATAAAPAAAVTGVA
jgi:hypothetical protein